MGHRPGPGPDLNGQRFDAAVVGCGPAGSLCALLLAQAGHSVLMLERERLPRPKTCGGGLSARALALLPCDIRPVVHRRMDGARLRLGGRVLADVLAPGIGAMVERAEFDAWLCQAAAAAGAELRQDTALTGLTQDADGVLLATTRGSARAHLVVGADGARSQVRQLLFPHWRPRFAVGLEARYPWPRDPPAEAAGGLAWFDFGALPGGYGWIFPKRDHFNVGVYRLEKPRVGAALRARLDAFVASQPVLADCLPQTPTGHPIPLPDARQPLAQGRVVLAGDAAGLGEAFLGEGIAFALDSGQRAARWAAGALRSGSVPDGRRYARALRPLVAELGYSLRMARLLYSLPPAWLARVAGDPGVQALVVDLLRARRSYRAAFWQLVWRVPAALVHPGRRGLTALRASG